MNTTRPALKHPEGSARPAQEGPRPSSISPAATPPAPPIRFHVQVGSYQERDSAVSLLRQLRARGYAATLVTGSPNVVWVGGYLDQVTAERLAADLRAAGFNAVLVHPTESPPNRNY